MKAIDLTGSRFGLLTVIREANDNSSRKAWQCMCDCGKTLVVSGGNIRRQQSCGCDRGRHRLHGTRTYTIWAGIVQRCCNPNYHSFDRYGGRGITLSDEWKDFATFVRDMGECPSTDMSIDRIDNDRGYERGNCRWATRSQQQRNRRTNRVIAHAGHSKTLAEWSESLGIKYSTLCARIRRGWNTERAFSK